MKITVNELAELARLVVPEPKSEPMPEARSYYTQSMAEASRMLESAVNQRGKISAIKVLRALTGAGLKEAKDEVERWWNMGGQV